MLLYSSDLKSLFTPLENRQYAVIFDPKSKIKLSICFEYVWICRFSCICTCSSVCHGLNRSVFVDVSRDTSPIIRQGVWACAWDIIEFWRIKMFFRDGEFWSSLLLISESTNSVTDGFFLAGFFRLRHVH